jgi:hypothetical protein
MKATNAYFFHQCFAKGLIPPITNAFPAGFAGMNRGLPDIAFINFSRTASPLPSDSSFRGIFDEFSAPALAFCSFDIKNPSIGDPRRADIVARPVSLPKWPHPLSGSTLPRFGRLARASALLLMHYSIWQQGLPIASQVLKIESSRPIVRRLLLFGIARHS